MAASSRPILTRIVLPYDVCQRAAMVGMWMIVAPVPEAISTRTETNATFENRGP